MYVRRTYMLQLEPCTTCMKLKGVKGVKRDVSGPCATSVKTGMALWAMIS